MIWALLRPVTIPLSGRSPSAPYLLVHAAGEKSTVHGDHFTIDEACRIARQKHRCAGKFFRPAEALQRRPGDEFLSSRSSIQQRRIQRRWEYARRNGVHEYAAGSPFHS